MSMMIIPVYYFKGSPFVAMNGHVHTFVKCYREQDFVTSKSLAIGVIENSNPLYLYPPFSQLVGQEDRVPDFSWCQLRRALAPAVGSKPSVGWVASPTKCRASYPTIA
jgi:hypothetical protein